MNIYYKLGLSVIALTVAFAFGRYSVSQPSTEVKTNQQETKNQDTHTVTTVVTTKDASGSEKIVQTTDTSTVETDKETVKSDTTTQPANKGNKLNVSLLAAANVVNPTAGLSYGLSVSKEIVGPVTIGAFGLNNGTLGMSVGVDF